MTLIPNFLRNAEDIVKVCSELSYKFIPRRNDPMGGHTGLVNASSNFSSLKFVDMPVSLVDLIFAESDFDKDLKDLCYDIQIQRYEPGQFIVPHRDNYETPKLHLVTLTTSKYDGLIILEDRDVVRIPDVAGQKIDYDFNKPHWVDPVHDLRYSLVIVE